VELGPKMKKLIEYRKKDPKSTEKLIDDLKAKSPKTNE
jgi:hypothetical protein